MPPYKTPTQDPTVYIGRVLCLPDDDNFREAFDAVFSQMFSLEFWDDTGGIAAEQAVALAVQVWESFYQPGISECT